MIKASELRIGNWVYGIGSKMIPLQVHGIRKNIIENVYQRHTGFRYNEITPIPLTSKILENAGFEKCSCKGYSITGLHLNADLAYNSSVVVTSVHQLQNLYFALTGEEMELNL